MAIDRADWHWESAEQEFRETNGIAGELTQEQINQIWLLAANHIGLFIQWIIDRGFEVRMQILKTAPKYAQGR